MVSVNMIKETYENTVNELEIKFKRARANHIKQFNKDLFHGLVNRSKLYKLATLVSQTIKIGRDDGYPSYDLPQSTLDVLKAARNAGILSGTNGYVKIGNISFYNDFSGICGGCSAKYSDYVAWNELREYKRVQTWQTL
jgi:hypothetical protein